MKAFLLFLVFFLAGLAIILSYQYWNPVKLPIVTTKPAITANFSVKKAPGESLQGTIATMSGNVSWLARTADKPVQLKSPRAIQQGEDITTGANGKAVVRIQNDSALTLSPNTHISIIQLLPVNFVFAQDKGQTRYVSTIQVPVSIRTFDLITLLTSAIVNCSVDPKNQTVTITVLKGTTHEAYEDAQNNSTILTVNQGQTFIFDETNKIGSVQ